MAYKMTGKSPLMKKLIGGQKNLPQHLQDAIEASPAKKAACCNKCGSPLKHCGCGKSPMKAKSCDCWDGYKRVPGTKPCAKGSCAKA